MTANGALDHEDDPKKSAQTVWVRPSSNVQGVGAQIVSIIEEHGRVTLRAIGAGAVNQAIKGAVHARQQLASRGEDLIMRPGFTTVESQEGDSITAVVLNCLLR